jgi:hypothetical protein
MVVAVWWQGILRQEILMVLQEENKQIEGDPPSLTQGLCSIDDRIGAANAPGHVG